VNISKEKFITMLERMASNGTAPDEGCSVFGVGYEDAFERIKKKYLTEQFSRGTSSEKFVVGPYGSGKTHFLRQLMEIASEMDCIISEVPLNKDIDFTNSLMVYTEVVRNLRDLYSIDHGIKLILKSSIEKVKTLCKDNPSSGLREQILRNWISGIDKTDLKLDFFGKVIKKALWAILEEDEIILDRCCRWLQGDINDKNLAKELDVPKIDKSSNNLYAKRLMMSLFQFIKHAKFNGTVVCFDEAEQGLSVNKKKTDKILSMLMSGIEAITNLQGGSAFIVYAITPDLADKMKNFPALQQRIISPRGRGFFDGNTLAPLIELTTHDPIKDLQRIGRRLVDLSYELYYDEIFSQKEDILEEIDKIAKGILKQNSSVSSRRDMVKETCIMLQGLIDSGEFHNYIEQDFSDEKEV